MKSEIKRLLDEKIVQAVIVFPSNLSRKIIIETGSKKSNILLMVLMALLQEQFKIM